MRETTELCRVLARMHSRDRVQRSPTARDSSLHTPLASVRSRRDAIGGVAQRHSFLLRSPVKVIASTAMLARGAAIGAYRILDMLGQGGMGMVYVGEHTL